MATDDDYNFSFEGQDAVKRVRKQIKNTQTISDIARNDGMWMGIRAAYEIILSASMQTKTIDAFKSALNFIRRLENEIYNKKSNSPMPVDTSKIMWHDTSNRLPQTDSEIECFVMQPKYNVPTIMYFGRAEQSWMNYDGLRLGAYEVHKWISLNELVEILDNDYDAPF